MTKICTDIDQSKKLAEILPIETADMWWNFYSVTKNTTPQIIHLDTPWVGNFNWDNKSDNVPCWSLTALFKLLPNCIEGAEPSLIKTFRNDYRIVYKIYGDEDITSEDHTNPVDACVEMILRFKDKYGI